MLRGSGATSLRRRLNTLQVAMAVLATALIVAVGGFILDWALLGNPRDWAYSDALASLVAALWAWVALRYYNKQQEIALAQLRMIAEVNHHVRNALTAMWYSVELTQDKALIEMTRSSIDRIDWTLREILPGKKPEEDDTPDNATRSRKAS